MTELRDLEARIRALEDIEAIKRLKHKYFRCIDKGLWDEIGNCFAEDGWQIIYLACRYKAEQ